MMHKLGIIGYGNRMNGIVRLVTNLSKDAKIVAIADPRREEMRETWTERHEGVSLYETADEMLENESLDGVLIGTRCNLHVELAVKVMARNLPMFFEKPVAITREQLNELKEAAKSYTAQCVVSFPLRTHPMVIKAKELIDNGEIGEVHQIIAHNLVTYGRVYFRGWYRDHSLMGGLFMQKATHDLDYVTLLAGARPKRVAAMMAQGRVFGGDMPEDLRCSECDKQETCPESPWWNYYVKCQGKPPAECGDPLCCFSKAIGTPESGMNEDYSSCMIEFENGVQATYNQNFFVKEGVAGRGATIIGYDGTIIFDWYTKEVKLIKHHVKQEQTFSFISTGGPPVHAADRVLAYDFIRILRGQQESVSPLDAGIESANLCLTCRESAEQGVFLECQ